MADGDGHKPTRARSRTTVDRTSECEIVVTRTFNAPARAVFEAWTTPELLKRWWAPASIGMFFISCELDARTGGSYRFVFGHPAAEQPMAFFGRYLEVTPYTRLVWTNDEAGDDGQITTVTFQETDGRTRLVMHERYPSKAALDAAGTGAADATVEMFAQLDDLLAAPGDGGRACDAPGP